MPAAILLAAAAGDLPDGAAPAPPPVPRVERVAGPAPEGSRLPNLARGADGTVYLSWIEADPDGNAALLLSPLAEDGFGEPRLVARSSAMFLNWADFPTVSALSDGTLAAAWLERNGEGLYAYGTRFSLSRDDGASWSRPRWLHEDRAEVEHGFVSLSPMNEGGDEERFGALWLDGRAMAGRAHGEGTTGLFFRTIKAGGELGAEVILDERVCDCCSTALAAAGGAQLVVYRDRSADEVRDISFLLLSGKRWSEPAPVHADGWQIDGCPVNGPRAAWSGSRAAVAWFTGAGDGAEESGGSVRVALMDAERTRFGPHVEVDDGAPEGRAELVALAEGTFLVAWLEHGMPHGSWRVRALEAASGPGAAAVLGRVSTDRTSGHLRMVSEGATALAAWTGAEGVVLARVHLAPRKPQEVQEPETLAPGR